MSVRPSREEFVIGQTYTLDFLDESEEGRAVEIMMVKKHGVFWILRDIIHENDKIKYKFYGVNTVFCFMTQTPEQSFIL
jgi:hypothetical protein